MDSVCGSIIMGFYYTHKNGFYETYDETKEEQDPESFKNFYTFAINMTTEELKARLDIIHHLKGFDIDTLELPSISDFDIDHYLGEDKLTLHLIDHNHLDCF